MEIVGMKFCLQNCFWPPMEVTRIRLWSQMALPWFGTRDFLDLVKIRLRWVSRGRLPYADLRVLYSFFYSFFCVCVTCKKWILNKLSFVFRAGVRFPLSIGCYVRRLLAFPSKSHHWRHLQRSNRLVGQSRSPSHTRTKNAFDGQWGSYPSGKKLSFMTKCFLTNGILTNDVC